MSMRDVVAAVFVLTFIAGLVFFAQHCALHNPPPCDPNATWPDPCAYGITETVRDGGHDAGRK